MPRTPHPRRYDVLRVYVLDARIVPRVRSGRATIQDVRLTLRKPAGETTVAFVSLATLRAHGLFADGRLSVVGGHYEVAIRGLGDGRSVIRQWGAECRPTDEAIRHELDIALTQLRACGDALGVDHSKLAEELHTFTSSLLDCITKHERTIALALPQPPRHEEP